MGLRKRLRIEPGTRVRLADIDPGWHGDHASGQEAKAELERKAAQLAKLQQTLYGEKKHALLIVLQGMDASGKDGTCWHVMSAMNPQGTTVTGFKEPTELEKRHDFLWRVHPHAPALGEVAVFNRSHYEDVLVARVHDLVPKAVWSQRYDRINEFERLLTDSGVTILKFFLHISPEEQLKRFAQRLDDPARRWKISESDYTERGLWDSYVTAYEAVLERCSTANAPWYVIPSNAKWFRNLAVSHIIESALEALHMADPEPTVDIAAIRRAYHQASRTKV